MHTTDHQRNYLEILHSIGFFASIFQSFINSAPTLVFDAIKPLLLSEAYVQISHEIDSNIEKVSGDHRFPNSISPLDMVSDTKTQHLHYRPLQFILFRPLLMHEKKSEHSGTIRTKSKTTIIPSDCSI